MKKFLIILLIISMLFVSFTSCNQKKTTDNDNNRPEINVDDVIDSVTIYIMSNAEYVPANEEVSIWEEYIYSRYNINFDLVYIFQPGTEGDFESTKNHLTFREFENLPEKTGLVFAQSSFIKLFRDINSVKPINDWVYDIKLMQTVNDAVIGSLTDNKRNLWAVPYTNSIFLQTRMYNEEWLNIAGMNVPLDVDEYRKYAEFIANNDPDGNGKDDTYIQEYSDYFIFLSFMDIFHAFGCYPDQYGPFGYNPLKGEIENVFLNENFIEALNFIKQLKEDNLIISGRTFPVSYQKEKTEYTVASGIGSGTYPNYWEGCKIGYKLEGINKTLLSLVHWGDIGYMVLTDTENPRGMIDALSYIENIQNGYMDLAYGVEGYNYVIYDEYIDVVSELNGSRRNNIGIYFVDNDTMKKQYLNGYKTTHNGDSSRLEYPNVMNDEEFWDNNPVDAMISSGTAYVVPLGVDRELYMEIGAPVKVETNEILINILTGNDAIEDVIKLYRSKLEDKGVLEKLDEINSKINN